jgi:hypothetical protein
VLVLVHSFLSPKISVPRSVALTDSFVLEAPSIQKEKDRVQLDIFVLPSWMLLYVPEVIIVLVSAIGALWNVILEHIIHLKPHPIVQFVRQDMFALAGGLCYLNSVLLVSFVQHLVCRIQLCYVLLDICVKMVL